jgi:hypothetical protein
MSPFVGKRAVWRAGRAGPVTSDRKSLVLIESTSWKPGGALQRRGVGPSAAQRRGVGPSAAWMAT